MGPDLHPTTVNALHRCLGDQTKDHRGNVGSHVRMEAIRAVEAILKKGPSRDPPGIRYIPGVEKLLSKVFGLAVEKLDSVRFQAFNSIEKFQFNDEYVLKVHKSDLNLLISPVSSPNLHSLYTTQETKHTFVNSSH